MKEEDDVYTGDVRENGTIEGCLLETYFFLWLM